MGGNLGAQQRDRRQGIKFWTTSSESSKKKEAAREEEQITSGCGVPGALGSNSGPATHQCGDPEKVTFLNLKFNQTKI